MTVILIVTFILLGSDKPTMQKGEMPDLQTCEVEAHKFMVHEFVEDVQNRIIFRSAACAMALPGKPT